MKIKLKNCSLYKTSQSILPIKTVTGEFYIYLNQPVNNRIPIGKEEQINIIGWIEFDEIKRT